MRTIDSGCDSCLWWKPCDDGESETGICTSVTDNDYAQTYFIADTQSREPTIFVTYASFWCSDYQKKEQE